MVKQEKLFKEQFLLLCLQDLTLGILDKDCWEFAIVLEQIWLICLTI